MKLIYLSFVFSLIISLIIAPLVIKYCKNLKATQTILKYVEAHKVKNGTPTMGGLIFILGISLTCIIFLTKNSSLAVVSCASMHGFGLLGFLDDYIKIKYKQNLGLNVWQKIVGQVGLSFIISFFAYSNQFIGSVIDIPFVNNSIDLGGFAIPFYMFIYLCITNSVNLTDGLDGLASGVSLIYLLFLGIIINFTYVNLVNDGASLIMQNEYLNLMFVAFAGVGALLAYLVINCFPAKIFMGDVGSLGLGGLIGTLTIFSNQIFIMPILGICFVWSALSVIIQVIHFKKTKKRVFLMAPFHHHLEMKGVHENRIVFIYITITASIGSLIVCFL